jgi:hypothetical protein
MTSKVWASENSSGGGGGGGGATDFTQLADAPTSYTGKSGLVTRVKRDESGLEFGVAGARTVRFVDNDNGDTTGGVLVGADLSAEPYFGNLAVGDSIFLGGAYTAADVGIWVCTAINDGVASVARRSDSLIGSLFVTGEPVFSAYDWAIHYVNVSDGSTTLENGRLDGSTIWVGLTEPVTSIAVTKAFEGSGINFGGAVFGATVLQSRVVRIDSSASPYNTNSQLAGVLLIDASAGDVVVTIVGDPFFSVANQQGAPMTLKRVDSSSNTVTVNTQGVNFPLDDGTTSFTLAALEVRRLLYEPGNPHSTWWTV